mgnify:CR=1 FL=1
MCPNRHILSFYCLKLTLSVKGTTVFIKTVDYFLKTVDCFFAQSTVLSERANCFDKKEDVSILTHPLTFYSIRNLMDFLSYTIGKLS